MFLLQHCRVVSSEDEGEGGVGVDLCLSHFFMPNSFTHSEYTNPNVTASAAVSALESSSCVSRFPRLSPGVWKGLAGINQAVEDILTVPINKKPNRHISQSDIVGYESCLDH